MYPAKKKNFDMDATRSNIGVEATSGSSGASGRPMHPEEVTAPTPDGGRWSRVPFASDTVDSKKRSFACAHERGRLTHYRNVVDAT